MTSDNKHILLQNASVIDALKRLNELGVDAQIFIINKNDQLVGAITDGDIRRGLIRGLTMSDALIEFCHPNPKVLRINDYEPELISTYRENKFKIVPIVDNNNKIVDLLNFRTQRTSLPISAVIMAGGEGKRLRPLTLEKPKPLIEVGDKPIIEHNIDRLAKFGINDITISINYLGKKIMNYFGDGQSKQINIDYIQESTPLGTLGSIKLKDSYQYDFILVMNSDILSNVDYEELFNEFYQQEADIIIATTSYDVQVPYAILETNDKNIVSIKEKPTYSYFSNAGIYVIKRELIEVIPEKTKYDATDLIEWAIEKNKKVIHYNIRGYWLDIGKPHDLEKARKDIGHLNM